MCCCSHAVSLVIIHFLYTSHLFLLHTFNFLSLSSGKPWTGPAQLESKDGTLMMLPADMALLQDKEFRKYVELYAKDEQVFFKDFSAAFAKLLELGVTFNK